MRLALRLNPLWTSVFHAGIVYLALEACALPPSPWAPPRAGAAHLRSRACGAGCDRKRRAPSPTLPPPSPLFLFSPRRSFAAVTEYAGGLAPGASTPFLRFASPVPGNDAMTESLARIPATRVTELPSGLRVATETHPGAATAAVTLLLDSGSRYESAASNGAAHFLEHLSFKGTSRRTRDALEREVEDRGAHLNAYTTREHTVYFAQGGAAQVPALVDLLADVTLSSVLDAGAVERERGVIAQEAAEVHKVPEEVVLDQLHATAFQRSPLGHTILGPADNVARMTREHLLDYVQTHYTAPRMVLVGAGGVDHDELVKLAEKHFASAPGCGPAKDGVPARPTTAEALAAAPARFVGSDVRIREPSDKRCHVAIAFEGASHTSADLPALQLWQRAIGEYSPAASTDNHRGSPLARRLAGLVSADGSPAVDQMFSFATPYADTGLFGVYLSCDADEERLYPAMVQAMRELTRPVYESDTPESLDALTRARQSLKSASLATQASFASIASEIGTQLLTLGRRVTREEQFARWDAVDARALADVAERTVVDRDPALAAFGETFYLNRYCDYNWVRRRSYRQRF